MHNLVHGGSAGKDSDIVVCLTWETTSADSTFREESKSQSTIDDELLTERRKNCRPRLIHLDWCICSVRNEFEVLDLGKTVVDPKVWIDDTTQERTRVTQDLVLAEGVSFTAAISKLTKSIERQMGFSKSKKIRVCTFND